LKGGENGDIAGVSKNPDPSEAIQQTQKIPT